MRPAIPAPPQPQGIPQLRPAVPVPPQQLPQLRPAVPVPPQQQIPQVRPAVPVPPQQQPMQQRPPAVMPPQQQPMPPRPPGALPPRQAPLQARPPQPPPQARPPGVPPQQPMRPPAIAPGPAPHVRPPQPGVPQIPAVRPVAPVIAPVVPPVMPAPQAAAQNGQLSNDETADLDRLTRTMDQLDYFELLEVEKSASPAVIKKAFYKKSRAFHPDRFFQEKDQALKERVHEVYKRITEAYAILRDDVKRPRYVADVTGPERAQKLRFTEASETEAKAQKKKEYEEQIGTTPKGRQFYATGKTDLDAGRHAAAERNFKMALTFEPQNQRYKDALKEAQDKLLEESRKSGSQFKIK